MNWKVVGTICALLAVLMVALVDKYVLNAKELEPTNIATEAVLFYHSECPHCKEALKYTCNKIKLCNVMAMDEECIEKVKDIRGIYAVPTLVVGEEVYIGIGSETKEKLIEICGVRK